jgi:hypothetical protein
MAKKKLDPQTREAVAARIGYYRELGVHDFYRRDVSEDGVSAEAVSGEDPAPVEMVAVVEPDTADHVAALQAIREDLGDCTRCPLHT